ncbi:MAG: hypothetical protein KY464_14210, partial [Gemmatimonadetes bacterium]|nr:hypothetical protein [Gemmatimonadota bacterium]
SSDLKLRSPAALLRLPAVLNALDRNTRTDLGRREAGALVGFLLSGPRTDTLLLPGEPRYLGGVSYWVPDEDETERLVEAHVRPDQARLGAAGDGARWLHAHSVEGAVISRSDNLAARARARPSGARQGCARPPGRRT